MRSAQPAFRAAAVVQLLALLWAIANISVYSHAHFDATGKMVVHAHPFSQGADSEGPPAKHTHARSEFITLQSFLDAAAAVAFLSFLLAILINADRYVRLRIRDVLLPSSISRGNVLGRAPPFILPQF